jgi:hypothetical protein
MKLAELPEQGLCVRARTACGLIRQADKVFLSRVALGPGEETAAVRISKIRAREMCRRTAAVVRVTPDPFGGLMIG